MDSAELVMCLLLCESVLVYKGGVHGGSGFIYFVCKVEKATLL